MLLVPGEEGFIGTDHQGRAQVRVELPGHPLDEVLILGRVLFRDVVLEVREVETTVALYRFVLEAAPDVADIFGKVLLRSKVHLVELTTERMIEPYTGAIFHNRNGLD